MLNLKEYVPREEEMYLCTNHEHNIHFWWMCDSKNETMNKIHPEERIS
jgi:hypothetical protein